MAKERAEVQYASKPAVGEGLHVLPAEAAQIGYVREMFLEYAASLDFSLCFQDFDEELATLPGEYVPPGGRLLLAEYDGKLAGCGALHRLSSEFCEMKRLYVRSAFRGKGVGRALAEALMR